MEIDSFLPYRTHPQNDEIENYVLSCPTCHRIKGGTEPVSEDGTVLILHPYKDGYRNEIKIGTDGRVYGITDAGKSTVEIMRLNRPELVAYRASNIAAFIESTNDGRTSLETYHGSIRQIRDLMKVRIEDPELVNCYYRMMYANVIAAMEAYLSKTIISCVLGDDEVFWTFVRNFDWNKEKVSVADIKEVYDGMGIKVQTALAEILYHNLPKVKNIYRAALGIDILTDTDELGFLCRAIEIRHDIVHRNGRSSEKDAYHIITAEMVDDLISHVDRLVDDIERQLALIS